jgi:hypothetical protein
MSTDHQLVNVETYFVVHLMCNYSDNQFLMFNIHFRHIYNTAANKRLIDVSSKPPYFSVIIIQGLEHILSTMTFMNI